MSLAEGFEELVAIVEHGSVTAASAALGLPRPTVSRRLARLEGRLGVRLLHRTTRRMKLSPQGEVLYPKARRVVLAARDAEAEVRRLDGMPRGLLRISAPMGLPAIFAEWMAGFLALHANVQLEVVASATHVDLMAEGFDLALRAGPIEDPSLIARTLVITEMIAVASPSYLASRGTPATVEDLVDHDCIVSYRMGKVPEQRWPLLDGGWVAISGRFKTNQMELRVEAARQGQGIALVAEPLAAAHVEQGELVHVLPGVLGRSDRVSLVYADREYLDPKVRAFSAFFVERVTATRLGLGLAAEGAAK